MKLAYWMYAGPAHIGVLRVASSFKNVHAIMHAPLGDDYFNVMSSMLERDRDFTPVTASIVDRHVLAAGSQRKVVATINRKDREDEPDLILVTPTCTSSILQEDLANYVSRALPHTQSDVVLADIQHYRINELQAQDRILEQVVRHTIEQARQAGTLDIIKTSTPSANLIGFFDLGFHHRDDCRELRRLLHGLGIEINVTLPKGGSIPELHKLPQAWFNIVPYREAGLMTAKYLQDSFNIPYIDRTPIGLLETADFIRDIGSMLQSYRIEESNYYNKFITYHNNIVSQAAWFARSIDCQNLLGKRVVVFGDSTHAVGITKLLVRELGVHVVCAGTYCKYDEAWFREQVNGYVDEVLITDDHTQVADTISRLEPAAIFGTQMERHIGKRLDIPCGVISAPAHIQNFPLSFRPFFGYEGTNIIADLAYNTFRLGMEEHLLEMFGGHDTKEVMNSSISTSEEFQWTPEAQQEIYKIPGFVRRKVKKATEKFAQERGLETITVDVLYMAKEANS
jgi:light-independent protochlorophyllide reductase subunit B